jgi:hypothetical protein
MGKDCGRWRVAYRVAKIFGLAWWEVTGEWRKLHNEGLNDLYRSPACVIRAIQCVRKVAVHLQKMLEVMSTSFYTSLNPFNFIRKHFLQICVRKVDVHL